MIVQEHGDGLLLFRQTDHALLSGAFAAAWGNETVPPPVRRDNILVAAARHDDGWAEWELAPKLGNDGAPVDFIHIPIREHVTLYKRGIDLVEAEDPYAGLVASLHGERLYTRPFYPGMDPRIEHLQGTDLELARSYVTGERRRQDALHASIHGDSLPKDAEEGWRLLQVWDRLSLFVCMNPLDRKADQKMPPIATRDGDAAIMVRTTTDGDVACDPFPFAADPAHFVIEAFVTRTRKWSSEEDYRRELRTAERTLVTFSCRAG